MKKIYVKIEGMHCGHCEEVIRNTLLSIKNIKEVNFDGFIACITYVGKLKYEEIIRLITDKGYIAKEDYISEDIELLKDNIKLKEFLLIFSFIILLFCLSYQIFGFNIFNIIPTIDSSITYGMLFITGLLTSIHCISMCGAINLMAVVNNSSKRSLKRPVLYNLGRVVSYTLLGGIVGFLGSILLVSQKVSGIIILVASIVMFLMSLSMLGIIKLNTIKLFKYRINSRNPFVIGLINGFMPCGPLQAMQVYALSTGSFIKGAISMLLFGLGTVPLMLFAGVVLNLVRGKGKIIINKVASVFILLLSMVMFNRGLLAFNVDVFKGFHDYDNFTASIIKEDYQLIEINLSYDNYEDIILQKGIPVKMIIHVDESHLTGCNNELVIDEFGIKQELKVGENIIEFTPTKEKTITYTCWMNMINNTIKVIDDKEYFKGE